MLKFSLFPAPVPHPLKLRYYWLSHSPAYLINFSAKIVIKNSPLITKFVYRVKKKLLLYRHLHFRHFAEFHSLDETSVRQYFVQTEVVKTMERMWREQADKLKAMRAHFHNMMFPPHSSQVSTSVYAYFILINVIMAVLGTQFHESTSKTAIIREEIAIF